MSFPVAYEQTEVQASGIPPILSSPPTIEEQDPSELYGALFERIQRGGLFDDSKHFVDMIPRTNLSLILRDFKLMQPTSKTELRAFLDRHFAPPALINTNFETKSGEPIESHIATLWHHLRRLPEEETKPECSLLRLPYSYIVPGGRFREAYYWDSYFTALGLLADGHDDDFKNMVRNFAHLLTTLGRIPNGNRDYYRGRSQPPFLHIW